jgi:AcrR family transcriptional regulator
VVDDKRKYELRQRADTMEATRQRIAAATIELHGTIGPARTTIAGIAARAGVQRHTVYRHFPTDDDLFDACSQQFWGAHPWPETERWTEIGLAGALAELYAYYGTVEPMLSNVLRDATTVDVVARAVRPYYDYLDQVCEVLAPEPTPLVTVATKHAIAFGTWRSLVHDNGLTNEQAAGLMAALVRAARG